MSLQGSLRFNPKDYVRTVFFGLHGSDNNDGLNENTLKREFWAAVATANLITLNPGERVCVVGLGTGAFDHADPSGTGQITLNKAVDVFAPHISIIGIEGTDPQPKLIFQGDNIFSISTLSGRPAVPSANGLLIERTTNGENTFINIDAFVNTTSAPGTGRFNFTGIINAEFFIKIKKINASTTVFNIDAANSFLDLEINQIVTAVLSTTIPLISINDSDAILKLDNISSGGSSGTLTGVLASGTANVCVYAFGFEGLDVDYETQDTATLNAITCVDNGNSLQGAGTVLNILSSQGENPVFVNQDSSNWVGNGQRVRTGSSYVEFGLEENDPDDIHDNTVYESGTATGTQTATTLQDTSKAWTVNEWAGYTVKITGGTNGDEVAKVISNTADTLTIDAAWITTIDNTSTYEISLRSRFTIKEDGVYLVIPRLTYSNSPGTLFGAFIYKNNVFYQSLFYSLAPSVEVDIPYQSEIMDLVKGDYVEVKSYSGSSGKSLLSFGKRNRMSITKISN